VPKAVQPKAPEGAWSPWRREKKPDPEVVALRAKNAKLDAKVKRLEAKREAEPEQDKSNEVQKLAGQLLLLTGQGEDTVAGAAVAACVSALCPYVQPEKPALFEKAVDVAAAKVRQLEKAFETKLEAQLRAKEALDAAKQAVSTATDALHAAKVSLQTETAKAAQAAALSGAGTTCRVDISKWIAEQDSVQLDLGEEFNTEGLDLAASDIEFLEKGRTDLQAKIHTAIVAACKPIISTLGGLRTEKDFKEVQERAGKKRKTVVSPAAGGGSVASGAAPSASAAGAAAGAQGAGGGSTGPATNGSAAEKLADRTKALAAARAEALRDAEQRASAGGAGGAPSHG